MSNLPYEGMTFLRNRSWIDCISFRTTATDCVERISLIFRPEWRPKFPSRGFARRLYFQTGALILKSIIKSRDPGQVACHVRSPKFQRLQNVRHDNINIGGNARVAMLLHRQSAGDKMRNIKAGRRRHSGNGGFATALVPVASRK